MKQTNLTRVHEYLTTSFAVLGLTVITVVFVTIITSLVITFINLFAGGS